MLTSDVLNNFLDETKLKNPRNLPCPRYVSMPRSLRRYFWLTKQKGIHRNQHISRACCLASLQLAACSRIWLHAADRKLEVKCMCMMRVHATDRKLAAKCSAWWDCTQMRLATSLRLGTKSLSMISYFFTFDRRQASTKNPLANNILMKRRFQKMFSISTALRDSINDFNNDFKEVESGLKKAFFTILGDDVMGSVLWDFCTLLI